MKYDIGENIFDKTYYIYIYSRDIIFRFIHEIAFGVKKTFDMHSDKYYLKTKAIKIFWRIVLQQFFKQRTSGCLEN